MGWLRLVGSLKLQVSFAEYGLFYRSLLKKRPMIWRSLLVAAIPQSLVARWSRWLPKRMKSHMSPKYLTWIRIYKHVYHLCHTLRTCKPPQTVAPLLPAYRYQRIRTPRDWCIRIKQRIRVRRDRLIYTCAYKRVHMSSRVLRRCFRNTDMHISRVTHMHMSHVIATCTTAASCTTDSCMRIYTWVISHKCTRVMAHTCRIPQKVALLFAAYVYFFMCHDNMTQEWTHTWVNPIKYTY